MHNIYGFIRRLQYTTVNLVYQPTSDLQFFTIASNDDSAISSGTVRLPTPPSSSTKLFETVTVSC